MVEILDARYEGHAYVLTVTSPNAIVLHNDFIESYGGRSSVLRLDYLSCVLTVISTILVGKRYWEGWLLAAVNSVIICSIAVKTAQMGFIPANLFCIVLYGYNLRSWRKTETS